LPLMIALPLTRLIHILLLLLLKLRLVNRIHIHIIVVIKSRRLRQPLMPAVDHHLLDGDWVGLGGGERAGNVLGLWHGEG